MKQINQIWIFFASVKLAIFTLCSLALTSIIGTIIPQGEPASFYADKYGPKTAQFFQILDIPEMYTSWWFISLLGLLSANLIICSFDRLPAVLKIIQANYLEFSPDRIKKMNNCTSFIGLKNTPNKDTFLALVSQSGWNFGHKKTDTTETYFAQKGKWSRIGVYIVHLSILIIFTGGIIGYFFGFKGSVMIPEMQTADKIFPFKNPQPIPLDFTVRCNSFEIEYYSNGMPKDYRSNLTIFENDKELLTKDIEVNKPLTYKGITFYQASYQGYRDFIIGIKNTTSGIVKTFGVPFQKQDSWEEENLKFGVINAEAAGQRIVKAKLWIKVGDNKPSIEWLKGSETKDIKVGDKQYTISVKQMYATGLQVSKDPGVWTVYIGCGLMMIGLYMAFFMSHKRIWFVIEENGKTHSIYIAGSANKNKYGFVKEFKSVVRRVEEKLQLS